MSSSHLGHDSGGRRGHSSFFPFLSTGDISQGWCGFTVGIGKPEPAFLGDVTVCLFLVAVEMDSRYVQHLALISADNSSHVWCL